MTTVGEVTVAVVKEVSVDVVVVVVKTTVVSAVVKAEIED